jgi:hypothetical protein
LTFLGHPVRKRPKYVFSILELLVGFLERLAAEEHLPREEKRDHESWKTPEDDLSNDKNPCQDYAEHSQK